eukprot:TRINITY_DN2553_c0_g3_i1.p1 TRINITY_DN2553_c0_g3~~TRINITY_DN2553_c0_g3_i1.p1  ORF type:complete len:321 (+),score=75.56 TRINITY_DN2553_c0_g3_i1:118-963(+)
MEKNCGDNISLGSVFNKEICLNFDLTDEDVANMEVIYQYLNSKPHSVKENTLRERYDYYMLDGYLKLLEMFSFIGKIEVGEEYEWMSKEVFKKYSFPKYEITKVEEIYSKRLAKEHTALHPDLKVRVPGENKKKFISTNENVRVLIQPWKYMDGSINGPVVTIAARKLTGLIIENPGITEKRLLQEYPIFSNDAMIEFYRFLEENDIIRSEIVSHTPVNVFSSENEFTILKYSSERASNPILKKILKNNKNEKVYFVTEDGIINLAFLVEGKQSELPKNRR